MLSDSATARMIWHWKRARLSTGTVQLGYPKENVISKARMGRSVSLPAMFDDQMTDAEMVQATVDKMSKEISSVFEAFHLMLIRGERCRELPHKSRALALGINYKTYKARNLAAFSFCQDWFQYYLDQATI
jgi:hypothetical protein